MAVRNVEMVQSMEALQRILTAIPYPVFVKDEAHRWVLVNRAFCKMMGQPAENLLNKSDHEFVPAAQADVFWAIDDQVLSTGEPNENEEVLTDASGGVRVITTSKCRVELPTPEGIKPYIVATFSDVTQYREAEARASYLAHHDPLTGLANRMDLGERLQSALEEARRSNGQIALFMLDLDGFKAVNDRHGHAAGDELLQVIAMRMENVVRPGDLVARLGGDEFCVIQVATDGGEAVEALARRISDAAAEPVIRGWGTARVSASVGISLFPKDGTSQEELLHAADIALYAVKATGRGAYARYRAGMDRASPSIEGLAPALAAAISSGQISLAFQPLISTADGTTRAFEALPGWHHPELGTIARSVFIPLAERHGLMPKLGREILEQACTAAAQWSGNLPVRVNVSSSEFASGDLVSTVEAILAKTGLPAERLEIEVAEAATLNEDAAVLKVFRGLKALGVKVAIVDFGAGWASLDVLRRIPFDRLKIDRSFVADMEADPRAAAIVMAVLSLGKALNVPVTAEGVERPEQLEALRNMGCDEVQGHVGGRRAAERGEQTSPATSRRTARAS